MSKKSLVLALAAACLLALPAVAEMLGVDQIVARNIASRGGIDAFASTETLKLTGNFSMGGGMEAPFTLYYKRPDKLRFEFTLQGMTAVQAVDGGAGWTLMPFTGQTEPQPMADEQLKQTKAMADFDGPLVDYQKKGHTIEYLGTEEVDGTPGHALRITMANGDIVTTYLGTEDFLEFAQRTQVEVQGSEVRMLMSIGDYKDVGPLVVAHQMEQSMEGMPGGQAITIQTIERNVDVDDSLFAMPAAPAAAE